MSSIAEEIIEHCHNQGIRFTFDKNCQVEHCKELAIWIQEITHQTEGKMELDLCEKHMQDFENDIGFNVVVRRMNPNG